jgi:carboxymethylenebutenolidase
LPAGPQPTLARQLAAKGYAVLMPNLFYRTARPPVVELGPDVSREVMMKRFGELTSPLTPGAIESDAPCYVDFFLNQSCIRNDCPMGVVGYCFSGAAAMRVAAVRADRIGAAASFHGGGLFSDSPASPHLVLPRIKARLYFGHAVEDPSMTAEAIEGLERALAQWGGEYESEVYDGAYHSWTVADSPVHNPVQAARAFEKLTDLLGRTLQ